VHGSRRTPSSGPPSRWSSLEGKASRTDPGLVGGDRRGRRRAALERDRRAAHVGVRRLGARRLRTLPRPLSRSALGRPGLVVLPPAAPLRARLGTRPVRQRGSADARASAARRCRQPGHGVPRRLAGPAGVSRAPGPGSGGLRCGRLPAGSRLRRRDARQRDDPHPALRGEPVCLHRERSPRGPDPAGRCGGRCAGGPGAAHQVQRTAADRDRLRDPGTARRPRARRCSSRRPTTRAT
jgi:hypothetical protein